MSAYLIRGTAVALSEFVLIYFATWATIAAAWSLCTKRPHRDIHATSTLLYGLQLSPFVLSTLMTALLVIPAFVRFEPLRGEEEFGPPIIILGSFCLLLFALGLWRAGNAVLQTGRLVRRWHPRTSSSRNFPGIPIVETAADAPPLVVAGLFRPRLYVSSSAAQVLSEAELARAIAHEASHVRRCDNVKKLVLRLCCVPPSRSIERRWLASLELGADLDAVSSRHEALDLASAIVKTSRLAGRSPDLAMTFATPQSDLLQARVDQLLSWETRTSRHSRVFRMVIAVGSLAAALIVLAPFYSATLLAVHEFSEFLVR